MGSIKYLYEGLFLFNPAAGAPTTTAMELVRQVLEKAGAEVVALTRWDERKLSYKIGSQKRGLYLLAYFRASGAQVAAIERDVNLSEQVTRCLILRGEHIGDVEIQMALENQKITETAAALESQAPPVAHIPQAAPAAEEVPASLT